MNEPINQNSKAAIEIAIRLTCLGFLLYWCFEILSPFMMPVLWAAIIAIAVQPVFNTFERLFKGRRVLSSLLLTVILLAVLLLPAGLFFSSLTSYFIDLKNKAELGTLTIPFPYESIQTWPLIGKPLYHFLTQIAENVESVARKYQSELLTISKTALNAVLGTSLGFLQLIFSVVIAGMLLAAKGTAKTANILFVRVAGSQGEAFLDLTVSTIRNVIKGVLGVAVIQTTLAGGGMYLANIPHAGIWTLICLFLTIIQVGPAAVLIGVIGYLFSTESMLIAGLWGIYFFVIMFADSILKPILMGKNADVPMAVIFLGVLGGFLLSGFIGMFTGAIVLSIGYKLLLLWMHGTEPKDQDSQTIQEI